METSAHLWRPRSANIPTHCPVFQPLLLTRRGIFKAAAKQQRQQTFKLQKLAAAVEAEAEVGTESPEKQDLSVEDLTTEDFRAIFDQLLGDSKTRFDVGDKVHGVVESVDESGAFVDIGAKAAAFLPTSLMSMFKITRAAKAIQPGVEREFYVAEKYYKQKKKRPAVVLSLKEFEREISWKRINQLAEEKASFQESVIGVNTGGLFVEVEGIKAFCPGSHIPQNEKKDGMDNLIGKTFSFSILEADQPRLILSARTQFQSGASQKDYKVGDVAVGTVQSVQLYGAFLELEDGAVGLLHISQISHDRVANVADVLSMGDKIKVMVLTHDAVKGRLSLSTRKLEPTPGDMIKNPALVFEKADEMAAEFRKRIAEAEAEFGADGSGLL